MMEMFLETSFWTEPLGCTPPAVPDVVQKKENQHRNTLSLELLVCTLMPTKFLSHGVPPVFFFFFDYLTRTCEIVEKSGHILLT